MWLCPTGSVVCGLIMFVPEVFLVLLAGLMCQHTFSDRSCDLSSVMRFASSASHVHGSHTPPAQQHRPEQIRLFGQPCKLHSALQPTHTRCCQQHSQMTLDSCILVPIPSHSTWFSHGCGAGQDEAAADRLVWAQSALRLCWGLHASRGHPAVPVQHASDPEPGSPRGMSL